MAQIKAIIFDMGGVILRSMDWTPREAQAKRLGVSRAAMENEVFGNRSAQLATVGACSEAEHWEAVRLTFGIPPQEMPAWRKEFWSGDRMDAELLAWLDARRPQYKTAMLSNAWPEARITVRQNYPGALNVFDLVIFSAEVQLAKPDERIYHLVCTRLGVQPEQAVFMDDVQENIEGARRIGMQGIQFKTPEQALNDLQSLLNGNQPG
jgi:HAD superfamily hydrolase (TIGR01509 family)